MSYQYVPMMPPTVARWNFIMIRLMLPVISDQLSAFGNQALASRIGSLVGDGRPESSGCRIRNRTLSSVGASTVGTRIV
jgi:hypothetical protein